MSHDRICTSNVSVVRINGNIISVGGPTVISYDGMRFGARACVFEPCKGYVFACFRARQFTASTVRARERQTRAPKKHILRGLGRGSYPAHVTVYPYNGYIKSTNPIVRCVMSLTWTMKRMRANQRTPKHAATQPLHDSNTRARAPNLVTS